MGVNMPGSSEVRLLLAVDAAMPDEVGAESEAHSTVTTNRGLHGQRHQMANSSSITHFLLLLPFSGTRQLQLLHFCFFLAIYLAALLVPKSMANSLRDIRDISYAGCVAQVFLPLHYETLLGSRVCLHMAAAAWTCGALYALLHTANTFSLPLCQGNAVEQFFCEVPEILKLSCSTSYLRELWLLVASGCFVFVCFVFIVVSYVQIFRAVLRIPSQQGRHKAFATCLPHLAVVSLFASTGIFAYLKPPSISSPSLDLVVSVLYSVVPPAVNPLIYSLRNQEIKDVLRKLIPGCFQKQ
ncbi:olfactory receptor 14A16-like [Melanerpes formicivorus]|uniref:olfactory receptor 14A16-like n=1 Tax=Melanerpes formicivorus TaxID=211600 RepID=UPI00358EA8A7